MTIIALITCNSNSVLLIEDLCSSNPHRFERPVLIEGGDFVRRKFQGTHADSNMTTLRIATARNCFARAHTSNHRIKLRIPANTLSHMRNQSSKPTQCPESCQSRCKHTRFLWDLEVRTTGLGAGGPHASCWDHLRFIRDHLRFIMSTFSNCSIEMLLCVIDPRVRKIRNETSSCPGIFSNTLRFYYVASSPGSPLPHLLDRHRKLVGSSAIPVR